MNNTFETNIYESPEERLARLQKELGAFQTNRHLQRPSEPSIWDSIDAEINPLSIDQRTRLMSDPKYMELQEELKNILNDEFIKFMKPYVENTPAGREILKKQLDYVKSVKGRVISETNQEMELFRKFQELVKTNPALTWEEFIKTL